MAKPNYLRRDCHGCGARNRAEPAELVEGLQCEGCKMMLPAVNAAYPVDRFGLEAIVTSATLKDPLIVEFWAAWSPKSKQMKVESDRVAERMAGRALVLRFNAEEDPETAMRFGVQIIPTVLLMRSGQVLHGHPDLVGWRQMEEWLKMAARSAKQPAPF